jgi:hypothetical protein
MVEVGDRVLVESEKVGSAVRRGVVTAGRSPLATGAAIRECRALGVRARVEAHRMATGPLLGREEDVEGIEDNRFISPTDTRGA